MPASSREPGDGASAEGIDAPLEVRFTHRLRFTRDAFQPSNDTLADALGPAAGRPHRVLAFVDEGVRDAWPDLGPRLRAYAEAHAGRIDLAGEAVAVPGGEAAKNDAGLYLRCAEAIDAAGICRHSYVLAAGGGAVLDVVGFAAATVHRGVRLLRLPTTTLSQADGGVGVKNGINLRGKKNLLGAFSPPWAVINDERFLQTLSDRDHRAGFSEVVKVALLKDPDLFQRTARAATQIAARDGRVARPLLRRSAELHLQHIAGGGDPFELQSSRPLDFGHWSAHKLEVLSGFQVRHGEAVAVGMALDVVQSALAGLLPWGPAGEILTCLKALGFALWHPALDDPQPLADALRDFREHLGGALTITLLRDIGRPVDVHEVDGELLRAAVDHLRQGRWQGASAAAG
jgi:3-dehydroquinate synthase